MSCTPSQCRVALTISFYFSPILTSDARTPKQQATKSFGFILNRLVDAELEKKRKKKEREEERRKRGRKKKERKKERKKLEFSLIICQNSANFNHRHLKTDHLVQRFETNIRHRIKQKINRHDLIHKPTRN